mgnify:CR=1 FL=1|tara:strand:- start:196 stop:528 length:333 start_codon:yes stop_codon:yes gene_type:complete
MATKIRIRCEKRSGLPLVKGRHRLGKPEDNEWEWQDAPTNECGEEMIDIVVGVENSFEWHEEVYMISLDFGDLCENFNLHPTHVKQLERFGTEEDYEPWSDKERLEDHAT